MTTRRTFLKTGSLAAIAVAGQSSKLRHPCPRAAALNAPLGELPSATDPHIKELAMRALDAAKTGGASYADVRFTITRQRTFNNVDPVTDSDTIAMGVRALVKGTWGFAANSNLNLDIAAKLGSKAAELAQVNAWSRVPPIQLIDRPPAAVGNWEMPVKRDPFKVPIEETTALIHSVFERVRDVSAFAHIVFTFQRQERTFASTDGAYITQTIYTSLDGSHHSEIPQSQVTIEVRDQQTKETATYNVPIITPTGAGYEAVEGINFLDRIPQWADKAEELLRAKKFDKLGRYDVVFDAVAMASIVDGTLGAALEYDRAIGYEAGAGGTSYLAPPLKILGTSHTPVAVTVTADRSMPGGCATVQWDDEGVTPRTVPFVKDGVVVDYATSREFVPELSPWYKKRGEAVSSNGCSASESASTVPLVYTPNLTLQSGKRDLSVDDLVANVDDGLLICGGDVHMDFQQSSGRGKGNEVYLIKKGKLAGRVKEAAHAFNSQDLWKNLVNLGGAKTASVCGLPTSKGEPNQGTVHSVKAVAAHFTKVQVDNEAST